VNFYPEETLKPIVGLEKSKKSVPTNSVVKTRAEGSPSVAAYFPGQMNDEQESTRRGAHQDLNNTGTYSSQIFLK